MMTKDEAIEMLKHCGSESHCIDYKHRNCGGCNQRKAQDMAIDALKSIKHGHWTPIYVEWCEFAISIDAYECSVCKAVDYDEDKYCPNCGAKMDGEEE